MNYIFPTQRYSLPLKWKWQGWIKSSEKNQTRAKKMRNSQYSPLKPSCIEISAINGTVSAFISNFEQLRGSLSIVIVKIYHKENYEQKIQHGTSKGGIPPWQKSMESRGRDKHLSASLWLNNTSYIEDGQHSVTLDPNLIQFLPRNSSWNECHVSLWDVRSSQKGAYSGGMGTRQSLMQWPLRSENAITNLHRNLLLTNPWDN